MWRTLFGSFFFFKNKRGFLRVFSTVRVDGEATSLPEGKGSELHCETSEEISGGGGSGKAKRERVACIPGRGFLRGGSVPIVGGATRGERGGEEGGEG